MKRALPTYSQVLELPEMTRGHVTEAQIDLNSHLNVLHYYDIMTTGTWHSHVRWGFGPTYPQRSGCGLFAVEHNVRYARELRLLDEYSTHARLLEVGNSGFHDILYVADRNRARVTAVLEAAWLNVDLTTRRVARFESQVQEALRSGLDAANALGWPTPDSRLALHPRATLDSQFDN